MVSSLFPTHELRASAEDIPLCYISVGVFDKNLNSYERYIVEKCFKTYESHIKNGEIYSKEEFLEKIKSDKSFERFVYLYVLVKEYWHAQVGTIVDLDFTVDLEDSLFRNYLYWGALETDNYYGYMIGRLDEYSTSVIDEETLKKLDRNKYFLFSKLYLSDYVGEEVDEFLEKFSLESFPEYFIKANFLHFMTEVDLSAGRKNAEKWVYQILDLSNDLPENYYDFQTIEAFKRSSLINLYGNDYGKARKYINELFTFFDLIPSQVPDIIKRKKIDPDYFDVAADLCDSFSYIYLTDAYFESGFSFDQRIKEVSSIFDICYVNPEYAPTRVEGEKLWWGLTAFWYEKFDLAYEYLFPSKYPKHFGGDYTKRIDKMVPAYFNYAALAALKLNKIDEAEEFSWHARDAVVKYEVNNHFPFIFTDLVDAKITFEKKKYFQTFKKVEFLKETLENSLEEFEGYLLDEDIDIFINTFLDLSFALREINDDYFVDPIFLFELKNLIFRNDNLLGLKKNNKENRFNRLIDRLNQLNEEQNSIDSKILKATESETKALQLQADDLNKDIISTRKRIFDMKSNLNSFYGISNKNGSDIQLELEDDEIVLFYNFTIANGRLVALSKNSIDLIKIRSGRNEISSLIKNLRSSLDLKSFTSFEDIKMFNFEASKELYESLVGSIDIENINNIYVYSHELLNSIPLQVLVKDFDSNKRGWEKYQSAKWLNADHSFALLESLTTKNNNQNYEKNFVGFGDPVILNNSTFSELPNTRDELISLALSSNANREDIYLREDANVENFRKGLQSSSRRLVIASHAFSPFTVPDINESGLLLSESDEEKFIFASEIAQLDIEADWVVLSACNTGFASDRYTKNYSSLAKAFLVAGANSVLMTNWNLESFSGSSITRRLFNEIWLNENLSKHEALRISSESLRKDLSNEYFVHPAFWGAYSVVYNSLN